MPETPKLDRQIVHGVLMSVYDVGVLVLGQSGSGKSELALEMIERGHCLVADDAVELTVRDGRLFGSAPALTRGILAIRGLGLIDTEAIFGQSTLRNESAVDMAILLFREDLQQPEDYLSPVRPQRTFLDVTVPLVRFDIRHRPVRPAFIETAVKLKKCGPSGTRIVRDLTRRHDAAVVAEDPSTKTSE